MASEKYDRKFKIGVFAKGKRAQKKITDNRRQLQALLLLVTLLKVKYAAIMSC